VGVARKVVTGHLQQHHLDLHALLSLLSHTRMPKHTAPFHDDLTDETTFNLYTTDETDLDTLEAAEREADPFADAPEPNLEHTTSPRPPPFNPITDGSNPP
jgi:hypothetical protein